MMDLDCLWTLSRLNAPKTFNLRKPLQARNPPENFIPLTNENFSHIWNNVKLSFLLLNALLNAMKANTKLTVLLFILPR